MKKWNWELGSIVLAISILGSLANKNYDDVATALFVGLIFGLVMGLFSAWVFK